MKSFYRLYEGEADLEAMIQLVLTRPLEYITEFPSAVGLREAFEGMPDIRAKTHLWEATDGRLVAFAIEGGWTKPFEIARRFHDGDLVDQLVTWQEERVRKVGGTYLEAASWDDDVKRIAFLEQHGFVRQVWQQGTLRMERSLHESIPEPQLPEGYTIRHVEGEHEVEALVDLHRAAFGTEWMTVQFRLATMHTADYDPELDLLAVAPDGTLAAYTTCWLHREQDAFDGPKIGYTEPVATHIAHRWKGLARGVLLAGFRLLRQHGRDVSVVTPWSENVAMIETAKSVGYRVRARRLSFRRTVASV